MAATAFYGDLPKRPRRTLFWRIKAKSHGQEDESGAKPELKEGWNPDHFWSSPSPAHRRSMVPQRLQNEIRFRDLVIDSLDELVPTDLPGCVSYYPLNPPDFICPEIESLKSNWIA